jgi:hypothetical protein
VRKRFGVVRKTAAGAALALFVVAQPQMLCALHCMAFDHMGDMDGAAMTGAPMHASAFSANPSAAPGAPRHDAVADPCGHGVNVITAPTLPVAGMGLATLPVVGAPVFGAQPTVSASPGDGAAIVSYTPRVDTPPPRV